jgi:hypothetical protein
MDRRFGHILNQDASANDAAIATVTHPYFKLKPIRKEKREAVKELFLRLAKNEYEKIEKSSSAPVFQDKNDEFFNSAMMRMLSCNIWTISEEI